MAILLIHLSFSPDVETDLQTQRSGIFRTHGFTSALALLPMMPLAWTGSHVQPHRLDSIRRSHPVRVSFVDASVDKGPLGMFIRPVVEGLEPLVKAVERESTRPPVGSIPFQVEAGTIPLTFEPVATHRLDLEEIPAAAIRCKETQALWLTETSIDWNGDPWYADCRWTVHYQRRLTVRQRPPDSDRSP